jgi:hypothetical protein
VQSLSEAQRYHDLDELCTQSLLFPHVSGQLRLLHTTPIFPSLVFSATVPALHHATKALPPSLRDDPGDARRGIAPTVVQASGKRRSLSPRESETPVDTPSRQRIAEVLHASARLIEEAEAIRAESYQVRDESHQRLAESRELLGRSRKLLAQSQALRSIPHSLGINPQRSQSQSA